METNSHEHSRFAGVGPAINFEKRLEEFGNRPVLLALNAELG